MSIQRFCLTIWALLLCAFAPSAFAVSLDEARALLAAGDYNGAREIGLELQSAQGFALAAESLSAQILLADVDKISKRAKEARALAQQGMALEPALYEAQLQYVLADGFVTRSASPLMVWRKKLPQKTYAKIEEFRTAFPEDARGLALEGAWHLAILRKAGAKNGAKWFGAELSKGQEFYESALSAAPKDIIILTNYAFALLALDADEYGPKVAALLEEVSTHEPSSDLERRVKDIAGQVQSALNETRRAKKIASNFLDGK